ncbi:MAG TPA: GGDEF domain-containing protein [Clostridiales bacterium]|nr:GGDEF domain-containing protein [Clostridiales bacterium]
MNSEQFEKYQLFTEKTIHSLSQQVTQLEKKLDMLTNLLEISKYINQYIKDPNLFPLINDMLIGVFGAKHSTIYIKMKDEYFEASSKAAEEVVEVEKRLIMDHHEEEFILNSKAPINFGHSKGKGTHSCLGVPVKVDNRQIAFILIQHSEVNYFTKEHAAFLTLIGNHIGVAIENNFLYKEISDNANRDGLTDIFNKRYFFESLKQISDLAGMDYSIVMMDIDNFKKINDTYGHPMGDLVLKEIAGIIKKATRVNDIVARYGGDEIILFLCNFTDREKVLQRIELIRKEIENCIITNEGISLNITASFGVFIKQDEALSLDEAIKKADEIMYLSKRAGKNKVTVG